MKRAAVELAPVRAARPARCPGVRRSPVARCPSSLTSISSRSSRRSRSAPLAARRRRHAGRRWSAPPGRSGTPTVSTPGGSGRGSPDDPHVHARRPAARCASTSRSRSASPGAGASAAGRSVGSVLAARSTSSSCRISSSASRPVSLDRRQRCLGARRHRASAASAPKAACTVITRHAVRHDVMQVTGDPQPLLGHARSGPRQLGLGQCGLLPQQRSRITPLHPDRRSRRAPHRQ